MAALDDPDPGGESNRIEIELSNPHEYPEVRVDELLPWLEALAREISDRPPSTLAVRFTDDEEVRRLNREFRDLDRATDVLSFPGGNTPEGFHLGDIALSVPTARSQAESTGHSSERELEILLLHGLLHCLGFDHETDDGAMDRKERELRDRWVRPS